MSEEEEIDLAGEEDKKEEEESKRKKSVLEQVDASVVRRAEALVAQGRHMGKAARAARSDEVVQKATPTVLERQWAKFPPQRQSIKLLDPVPDSAPTLVIELQDFVKLVRATCNGIGSHG